MRHTSNFWACYTTSDAHGQEETRSIEISRKELKKLLKKRIKKAQRWLDEDKRAYAEMIGSED